ncbi:hypothetical protein COS83_01175 [archaeon CG07_land_8_20_14_0_80_38_8]|nr:MAG: hypothetical protein COS83_01175 [archaeon CG07_land_8_20_14_0_80_38_8]PIU88582.1 MAG: hypothetical protein COS64_03025 [archaeon CG06_land_8_20_14_3_00_37_11]
MDFNNLEEKLKILEDNIAELTYERNVLQKEQEFRRHINEVYPMWYKRKNSTGSIEEQAGGYLCSVSRIKKDNIEWFAEYKKDDEKFSKAAKDMNDLLEFLDKDEINLSEAKKLKNELVKYGFKMYFMNPESAVLGCDFCKSEEVRHGASISLILESCEGDALDHGYTNRHYVKIVHDEPVILLKDYKIKVKKELVEDYKNKISDEWHNKNINSENIAPLKEIIEKIENKLSPVKLIEKKNYTISVFGLHSKACDDCLSKKDELIEKIYSMKKNYDFIQKEWLFLEIK